MKLSERTGGKKYRSWVAGLSKSERENELLRCFDCIEDSTFLRQSEFFNEDKFGGDIIVLDVEKQSGAHTNEIKVLGDAPLVLEEFSTASLFPISSGEQDGKWIDLGILNGRKVRFVMEMEDYTLGVDYVIENNEIRGSVYLSQTVRKPMKFSRILEFSYKDDVFEMNIVEKSVAYLLICNTSDVFRDVLMDYASEVQNYAQDFLFSTSEGYWTLLTGDESIISAAFTISFEALVCEYCCTLNRDCGFEELNRGLKFKDEVYDFYFDYGDKEFIEKYTGDKLDMGIIPLSKNTEYLTLVSKIAQLGSEVVVPRNSILDLEDFTEYYFKQWENDDDAFDLRSDKAEELAEICNVDETALEFFSNISVSRVRLEDIYFCYVWNNLYFRLPKIWSKIRVLGPGCLGYDVVYDEFYKTLELSHVIPGGDEGNGKEAVCFRGDIDLEDVKLKTYTNNSLLSSLRFSLKTINQEKALSGFVERYKEVVDGIDGNEEMIYAMCHDLELCSRLFILRKMRYTFAELVNMASMDDKMIKVNCQASAIEDYSWVLVNYIIICTLICEKDKLKQVLSEMEEEEKELGDEVAVRRVASAKESEIVSRKGNVYVFNSSNVKKVDDLLGVHLKRKRKNCKYTTPFWVRRGYYKTVKNGERIWVPEQVCRRSPELLSIEVGEKEDGRVYKATDLFK